MMLQKALKIYYISILTECFEWQDDEKLIIGMLIEFGHPELKNNIFIF